MKKLWPTIAIIAVLLLIALAYVYYQAPTASQLLPPSNSDQPAGGIPLKIDSVRVDYPKSGSVIKSPVTITGKALGLWYFEATFPVEITDANGNTLGQHYAEAQSDWMTIEAVPFVSTISFKNSPTDTGFIILKKDNPSGLPEHDAQVRFPVRFR